ncbi:hypothetical protein [Pseudomonas sp. NMI1173_11]|uniref:hypothetical protein n=1 Tax=Pseudomonas sp. NMI1173_11 TaxID=2903145 RepID=UPI001E5AB40A|nr:hypothetical protein [Pseudomonas sp. NMI1173_11]MCE1004211.1 hypothetical protein [Pseudomonas sp. NMI1173_11]
MAKYLSMDSKSDSQSVIFLRSDAPAAALFEGAYERQLAALELLQAIGRCEIGEGDANGMSGLARAAALLVHDASTLYEAAHRSATN